MCSYLLHKEKQNSLSEQPSHISFSIIFPQLIKWLPFPLYIPSQVIAGCGVWVQVSVIPVTAGNKI
jgi:hypothetical protein